VALFGSKRQPSPLHTQGKTIELMRLAMLMSGKSVEESRAAEQKATGHTLEDMENKGHQCSVMAQAPDGSYWTARGKAKAPLAEEMARYFPTGTKRDVEKLLREKGLTGLSAIKETIDKAVASRRVRAHAAGPVSPYRLNQYGCCFGEQTEGGKRAWLLDPALFGKTDKSGLRVATAWLALKELGVQEPLLDAFLAQIRNEKD
jgi:hypothetical protein